MRSARGVLGAHLLIMQADRDQVDATNRLAVLNEVVPNLRLLMGTGHPDVEAISLRCPSEDLHTTAPFQLIPMFERSWRLMVEASAKNPDLVPAALWQRAHAIVKMGGYLVWARDSDSQKSYLEHLNNWLTTMAGPDKAVGGAIGGALSVSESDQRRGGLAAGAPTPAAQALESVATGAADPLELVRQLGTVPAAALQSLLKGKAD
jgi:hypothetical protein